MIRYVVEAVDDFNSIAVCDVVNLYDLRGKATTDPASATACVIRIRDKFLPIATDEVSIFPVH